MSISPYELRNLADYLENDMLRFMKNLRMPMNRKTASKQKYSVAIINHSKCSDTWEFEKMTKHKTITKDGKKRYLCNQAVDPTKEKIARLWKDVTCKNCLKHN